jgi:hypothetical protein
VPIVHNSSTGVLLALDKGAGLPATEAFDLTRAEVALLERAVQAKLWWFAPVNGVPGHRG